MGVTIVMFNIRNNYKSEDECRKLDIAKQFKDMRESEERRTFIVCCNLKMIRVTQLKKNPLFKDRKELDLLNIVLLFDQKEMLNKLEADFNAEFGKGLNSFQTAEDAEELLSDENSQKIKNIVDNLLAYK